MNLVMRPATYLLLAAGAIVAGCTYFENYRPLGPGPDNGVGELACGFLVVAAAALLGAAHLHTKP